MRFGSKRRERAAIEPSPSWSKEPRSVTAESQPRPAVLQRASRVTAAQNMRASERRPFANLGFVLGLPELLEEGLTSSNPVASTMSPLRRSYSMMS